MGERGWGVPIQTRGQTLWYSKYLPIYAVCVPQHRVHIFTRDETGLVYLPTGMEPVSDPDPDPGFGPGFESGSEIGSGSETNFRPDPDPKQDPILLFRIRNTGLREASSK
jgi:hypothetical protein